MQERKYTKIACIADDNQKSFQALSDMQAKYCFVSLEEKPDIIIVLGGDGFMLHSLHHLMHLNIPLYGMNVGHIGFLMNIFSTDNLLSRIEKANITSINPLHMLARCNDNTEHIRLAINEIYLLRDTNQAARINIYINDILQINEMVCDGIIVSTAAGSTAYNLSAGGPVIPLEADLLALTPLNPFRPRRWKGALLPSSACIKFEILESEKRSTNAVADFYEVKHVISVDIKKSDDQKINLLFDEGHSLEERIIREQFSF
ncbi:putative inorganic polyphosphate/ATP-NAD kinase [Rickettsiales bacterium Ac37b]|nr:putative inorganic polyphosphate/ATP-NAD kinase [Rickettsiales bacterium Ac37b]